MHFIIHRGSNEIGGSCVEVKSRNSRIVIDIGVPIVTTSGKRFDFKDYRNLLWEKIITSKLLRNVKGLYGQDSGNKPVDGLLISHAHIDHYGLYNFVDKDIQYHLGEATHKLINLSNIFIKDRGSIEKVAPYIQDREQFNIEDFKITPFLMDHSAFDAYAFLIEADEKKLFYSGDFRSHGRKGKLFYKFLRIAPEGINVLLLEGTLIKERASSSKTFKTEEVVENEIVKVLEKHKTIVFGIASSQNIDRMVSFYKAAKRKGRLFVIDVYTANILSGIGKRTIPHPSKDYPEIKVFFPKHLCDKLKKFKRENMMFDFKQYKITRDEISKNLSNVFMMVRPSIKSYLEKIENIGAAPVIYSMWEGYMEDAENSDFIKYITKEDDSLIHRIHTSGHADVMTLKELVNCLKPDNLIPIHTLNPEMYDTHFENVRDVSDGQEIEI